MVNWTVRDNAFLKHEYELGSDIPTIALALRKKRTDVEKRIKELKKQKILSK